MMNTEKACLDAAIAEATEFLKRARALRDILKCRSGAGPMIERSALRRQSMDLTRALAKLRNPPWVNE